MTRSILSIAFWRPVWFKKIALYLDYQDLKKEGSIFTLACLTLESDRFQVLTWSFFDEKYFFKKFFNFTSIVARGPDTDKILSLSSLCLVFDKFDRKHRGEHHLLRPFANYSVHGAKVLISFSFQRCRTSQCTAVELTVFDFFRLQEGCCSSECWLD